MTARHSVTGSLAAADGYCVTIFSAPNYCDQVRINVAADLISIWCDSSNAACRLADMCCKF